MRKNKLGWAVGIVVCSHCNKKWVAVRPTKTKDEQLECPKCGKQVPKRYRQPCKRNGG